MIKSLESLLSDNVLQSKEGYSKAIKGAKNLEKQINNLEADKADYEKEIKETDQYKQLQQEYDSVKEEYDRVANDPTYYYENNMANKLFCLKIKGILLIISIRWPCPLQRYLKTLCFILFPTKCIRSTAAKVPFRKPKLTT